MIENSLLRVQNISSPSSVIQLAALINTGWAKKISNLFLSELRQIYAKFDNCRHT